MNIQSLEGFVCVAKTGSINKAAAELSISQPALSSAISSLERELGFVLLDRGHEGTRLTLAGKTVLPIAEQLVAGVADLVRRGREVAGSGAEIRIGCGWIDSIGLFPKICEKFSKACPDVSMRFVPSALHRYFDSLVNGTADVCAATVGKALEERGLGFAPLFSCGLSVAMASDHLLADSAQLRLEDLRGSTLVLPSPGSCQISDEIRQECVSLGIRTDSDVNREAESMLLASHKYVLAMPAWIQPQSDNEIAVPLSWPHEPVVGLAWRSNPSAAVRRFIEIAREVYEPASEIMQFARG